MKLLLLALAVLPSIQACVHTFGYILHDSLPGLGTTMDSGAQVVDNGQVVCDSGWGVATDGANNFAFTCLPGFSHSISKNGQTSWYTNNGNAHSWTNSVKKDGPYCCHGACDDRKGFTTSCTGYQWDTNVFC